MCLCSFCAASKHKGLFCAFPLFSVPRHKCGSLLAILEIGGGGGTGDGGRESAAAVGGAVGRGGGAPERLSCAPACASVDKRAGAGAALAWQAAAAPGRS